MIDWGSVINRSVIRVNPWQYTLVGQGTWTRYSNLDRYGGLYVLNTSHADLDNLSYRVNLGEGTWTMAMISATNNNLGIVKLYLDGVLLDTMDPYDTILTINVETRTKGIRITEAGIKELKVQVDGKNPLATDYYFELDPIEFWRTS